MLHEKLQVIVDIIGIFAIIAVVLCFLFDTIGLKKLFGSQVDENTKRIDKLENRLKNIGG